MTFIAIEGIDGAGKATQTKLLAETLEMRGIDCFNIDFPQYRSTKAGARLREWLDGKHGDFVNMNPRDASMFYAFDRLEAAEFVLEPLARGAVVIADRYTGSNQIHQGGKFKLEKERTDFLEWLDWFEHEVLKNPRPDLIVYLDMPVGVSLRLLAERNTAAGTKPDQVESSRTYLENGSEMARWLAARNENWRLVSCADAEGNLRSPEDIHHDVLRAIEAFIPMAA